jgi:subtilisin family serine protease
MFSKKGSKLVLKVLPAIAVAAFAVHTQAENFLKKSWGLSAPFGVDAPKAWAKMSRDCSKSGIVVAVVDTGIDRNHPALKGALWSNPKEIAGNGIDDDKNGLVDDVNGWDYAKNSPALTDNHGHGTHIAGIIASNESAGTLGTGLKGVCPGVRIMALRYYDEKASGADNLRNTIKALEYAVNNGANVINYSGGGAEFSRPEFEALKKAEEKGILVVAAAGNERSDADKNLYFPAAYNLTNIISVTAIDSAGQVLSSSNWGVQKVHVAAPGQSILSALPNGGYGFMTGTSQATAFVSGIAALLLTENPRLNFKQLKEIIEKTAYRQPSLVGKTKMGARVNALSAVLKARETRGLSSEMK